jgi:predicted SAM-dependent methyltransferase
MKMVNIGCGSTHHPAWVNLDISSADPSVLRVNIHQGLPFEPNCVGVCYSSHVLEHLDQVGAKFLLSECFRIMQPGGTIRLAVPDLERTAREYIRILDSAISGRLHDDQEYDWIMMEMFDQTVRNISGGAMAKFLRNLDPAKRTYIHSRIGAEADIIWAKQEAIPWQSNIRKLIRGDFWRRQIRRLRGALAGQAVFMIAGSEAARSFRLGRFKTSGEIHQWMYDRFSLARLLRESGFMNVKICTATESQIPRFDEYQLDSLDGVVRKPDSLFIEGRKA